MKYSITSYKLTDTLDKHTKKQEGIFFTPPDTVIKTLFYLKKYLTKATHVLEPSFGSGEYIDRIYKQYPTIENIVGIEANHTIYQEIIKKYPREEYPNLTLLHMDFLKYFSSTETNQLTEKDKYDVIVGNPPYFVMKKSDVDKSYTQYFDGRPNIFILFIIHSLHLLKKDGVLSFILPKNFLNSIYYEKTRRYIYHNYTIIRLENCNDMYIETKQETILLIVQNRTPLRTNNLNKNDKYSLHKNNITLFGTPTDIQQLQILYESSTNISNLGFTVKVGSVVWNQVKSILTDDDTKTRLIYSSDIQNRQLYCKSYSNPAKKNYINKPGIQHPMLVINRGYGIGTYKFDYCLIDVDYPYLIENHLICILPKTNSSNHNDTTQNDTTQNDRDELIEKYEQIMASFEDPRTEEFIHTYFGNNSINTTELNYIVPIYTQTNDITSTP